MARYGRSKEKRYDCPLVVFTGVINPQGFLRHSRIYQGNKADPDTLEDMLRDLDQYSDPAHKKTVVLDAGIAAEQNLELIQGKGYEYMCVSRKRIKDFLPKELITQQTTAKQENVKLSIFHPPEHSDTWMYVQSDAKRKQERLHGTKACRPANHQKDQRVESHIYLTLLAYQVVNTIPHMLKAHGINHDWANIKRIMATYTVQTIELPTDTKTIHLRKPSKPIEEVQQIYHATGCTETQKASRKYVVYH